jgi:hypothetical protein
MASILILDDRNTNRKILAQLAISVEPGVAVKPARVTTSLWSSHS